MLEHILYQSLILSDASQHSSAGLTDTTLYLTDYRMDEDEPDSKILRLQFFRNPGPRPGQRGGRR